MRLALTAALALALVPSAAAATDPGARVFGQSGCAACHTLAVAKAKGTVGPNLDVVRPSAARVAERVRSGPGVMPSFAGRLSARQISQVASFVASAAARAAAPRTGRALFRGLCGRCHTLAAAGTRGTVGPNLTGEDKTAAEVAEKVRDGDGAMPSFRGRLTPAEIRRVAAFVAASGHG